MARRPQCQRRRSQVLPTAAAGGDDPMQQQVDQVGVFREGRRRAAETVAQQLQDGAIGRTEIFRRRILQLPRGQRPVGAPAARFENADHAQIEDEGQTRPRRVIETIAKLIRSRRRAGHLTQPVQPAADRADERVALGSLDRRRILQRLQQHRRPVLAVPRDRAAASGRQRDGIAFPDIDEDAIRPQPRPLDRRDQALAALVGPQVAHRAAALVGTSLVDLTGKTAPDVALVERKPGDRRKPSPGEWKIVQQLVHFVNGRVYLQFRPSPAAVKRRQERPMTSLDLSFSRGDRRQRWPNRQRNGSPRPLCLLRLGGESFIETMSLPYSRPSGRRRAGDSRWIANTRRHE